jgi:outer membrane murein-binding lipoprotein Lpp
MQVRVAGTLIVVGVLSLAACSAPPRPKTQSGNANTPAGKVGQAAYKASVEIGKAGKTIGQKLNTAAHNAHAGWNEAARKNQSNDPSKK